MPFVQRALELAERNDTTGRDTLSLAYYMNGDAPKAIEHLKEAIDLLPPGESTTRSELKSRLAEYEDALAKANEAHTSEREETILNRSR